MFIIYGALVSYASFCIIGDIYFLKNGIKDLQKDIAAELKTKNELQVELGRLTKQEAVYSQSLSIMQQELPTIEIFDAIDKSTVRGVILTSMVLNQKELKVVGVANTEDNIVTTIRNLLDSEAFSIAQVPVVTRENMGPEGLKFTLSLAPKPIGESGRK
jgi:Tfp pilus assembly protein PilN